MNHLTQGTSIKLKNSETTGTIVGLGPEIAGQAYYIIETDKQCLDSKYPYSHFCASSFQIDVIEDEPLVMPDNAFTAEDARNRIINSEATYAQAYTNMLKAIFTAIDTACMIKDSNYARLVFGAEYTDVVSHELMYKIQEDLEEMGYEMSFNFSDYFDIWIWW